MLKFTRTKFIRSVLVLTLVWYQFAMAFPQLLAQRATPDGMIAETPDSPPILPEPTPTKAILSEATGSGSTVTDTTQSSTSEPTNAGNSWIDTQVEAILGAMNPADKVGQLFVISFQGNNTVFDPGGESDGIGDAILQLIYAYRIGGVILSPRNGNFTNAKNGNTPRQVAVLVNRLQSAAYGVLLPEGSELQPVPNEPWPPPNMTSLERLVGRAPQNLPLLIGVEQIGDGLDRTALRQGGFTELPSPLALGSTWNPELAAQIGEITGRELRAVGVNLLLGPNLDVVDTPRDDAIGVLGTYSFGGSPFWVARMGRSYIAGVHQGSEGHVATIASHFPGQGDIDRIPDEDVATIQKNKEDFDRLALAPFVSVTARPSSILSADGSSSSTDGLMSSHMRFTALQGPASARTAPFDLSTELSQLIATDRFKLWRDSGGIMMSGSLGTPAIRRFYDPESKNFPAKQIAQAAFNAGNDLLFLDQFAPTSDWASQLSNIQTTIGLFHEQYRKDPTFAAQVDASVRRILHLKLSLYAQHSNDVSAPPSTHLPIIPLSAVLTQQDDLALFESPQQEQARLVVSQVARESISLLYPDPKLQSDSLLLAPREEDKVVIFTDSRLLRECESCTAEAAIGPDAIAKTIELFYGEDSTGQLPENQVTSLTFSELNELLEIVEEAGATAGTTSAIEASPTSTISDTTALPAGQDTVDPPEATTDLNAIDKNTKNEMKIAEAQWLIFAMLDVDVESHANSIALKQFLKLRGEQLQDKKIIVLALGPPYFLDATEISKLTAYYGVYGRGREFIENAVRAIFRSYAPAGSPSVDVPGTRFAKLVDRLQPDPAQNVPLLIYRNGEVLHHNDALESINEVSPITVDALPNSPLIAEVGPILDLNGNIVADGTTIELRVAVGDDTSEPKVDTLSTVNGLASRELLIDQVGSIYVSAQSGKSDSGEPLNLTFRISTTLTAETNPTTSTLETNTSITPTVDINPIDTQIPPIGGMIVTSDHPINFVTLVLSLLTIGIVLSVLVLTQVRVLPRTILVNSMCWATICGLGSYIIYGYGWIPGTIWLATTLRVLAAPILVFISMLIPLLWLQLREVVHLRPPPTE